MQPCKLSCCHMKSPSDTETDFRSFICLVFLRAVFIDLTSLFSCIGVDIYEITDRVNDDTSLMKTMKTKPDNK